MSETTLTYLNHPLFKTSLSLARVPKYLRFVCMDGVAACSRSWDALDQLDDKPDPNETLIAAVLKDRGTVHFDGVRNGKRFGEWHGTAKYELMDPQPSQEIMRDGEQWKELCLKLDRAEAAK